MTTMTVTALGVAGGPAWMLDAASKHLKHGISTLVEIDGRGYLIDVGSGAGRQLARAGRSVNDLRAIFVTHLHSDHVIDLAGLTLFGIWPMAARAADDPIRILGPGDRGMLPPLSPRATTSPRALFPENPTPGVDGMLEHLLRAHAADYNDRIFDTLSRSPADCFVAEPIAIPEGIGYHPNDAPFAETEPWEIFRDERVVVTTTLVRHPPMAPAFAFRIDSEAGSVVVSGDTAPSSNLERLAAGATVLFHEAFDFAILPVLHGPEEDWDEGVQSLADHHRGAHTDPADAVAIARRAGVGQLALHHLFPPHNTDEQWHAAAGDRDALVLRDLDRIVIENGAIAELPAHHTEPR